MEARLEVTMEFHVRLPAVAADLGEIEAGLIGVDPAAVADLDAGGTLRVATTASPGEIAGVLAGCGLQVPEQDILPQPSVCCGGCSG